MLREYEQPLSVRRLTTIYKLQVARLRRKTSNNGEVVMERGGWLPVERGLKTLNY